MKVVDKFTYLGCTISRAVHIDDEVTARTFFFFFFFFLQFELSQFSGISIMEANKQWVPCVHNSSFIGTSILLKLYRCYGFTPMI